MTHLSLFYFSWGTVGETSDTFKHNRDLNYTSYIMKPNQLWCRMTLTWIATLCSFIMDGCDEKRADLPGVLIWRLKRVSWGHIRKLSYFLCGRFSRLSLKKLQNRITTQSSRHVFIDGESDTHRYSYYSEI